MSISPLLNQSTVYDTTENKYLAIFDEISKLDSMEKSHREIVNTKSCLLELY